MQVALEELMFVEAPTWVEEVEAQVRLAMLAMVPHHRHVLEELGV